MTDFDDDLELEQTQPLDPNIRKQLREAEKARKELAEIRAELERTQRESLFTEAGIPKSGAGALLRKAYDGAADIEAIRKAAEEYGVIQPEAPVVDTSNQELEALRRAQGATAGTTGAMPSPDQEFVEAVSKATSPEEVMKVVQGQLGQRVGVWTSRDSY